ncbi:MAG: ATP-binding protein, partial [Bacteroidales bacterium]|nr:ATP-binding protein [Bacteroidales bacterium]
MLVQFSFSNYKSFKDEAILNLVASGTGKKDLYCHKMDGKTSLQKTVVVYGANASGKTKLFDAFNFMKSFISPPKRDNRIPILDYWQTKYDTFRLNTASEKECSFFETVMVIDGVQYRYGVELNNKEVLSEWLYLKRQREINVFSRDGADIKFNKEQINVKVANNIISADMVSPSSSFLAVLKTFNEPLATKIVNWFDDAIVISANDIRSAVPLQYLADEERKKVITKFMKAF